MADETIGGIRIPIEADFSDLGPEMDAAISQAKEKADAIASAITQALADINTDGVSAAFIKLGENAAVGADGVQQLWDRMKELQDSGAVASQNDALAQALREMGDAAQAAVANLQAVAAAQKSAGDAATQAAGGQKAFSEGAQAVIDKQAQLDENLRQAIGVLNEIQTAFQQGAVSADTLAQAEKGVDDALRAASPGLESVKNNLKETADETKTASDKFAEFGLAMAAVAEAFAFTAGLKEFGMAALEAGDHVDDAGQAMARFDGSASATQQTIAQLRQIASDEALSFPNVLVASQRMTAFLGSSEQIPAIMRAAGDAAAVLGVNIDTTAKAVERFAAGGDISTKSLKQLGLTMGDMAAALGTTEANAKKAFAALDQSQKVDAVVAALGKFNGAATEMNNDALGALVRLGQSWSQVLEQIGIALEPVVKAMADFARSNIVEPIRNLVEAFNQLPAPVKDFAVALGIAAAAIVPIAAGIAGVVAAIGPLTTVFGVVAEAVGGLAATIGGALAVSLSEVLVPIAAVGAAIALLHFTGLDEDIMNFVSGPLAQLKTAFAEVATDIGHQFTELKSAGSDFFESFGGLLQDLGPIIKDLAENFSPLGLAIQAFGGAAKDAGTPLLSLKDVIRQVIDLCVPFIGGIDALVLSLKGWKSIIDEIRPVLQLLGGDMSTMKTATAAATDAMRLQQDLANQNARLLADQAMGLNKVADASNQYAAGLKTIQEQQTKLNDAVTQAKGVLDAAKAAYDGTAESQQVLNRATADYEKAVKAATAQTDAMKESSKAAKDAAKELAAEWKTANDDIQKFNDIASKVPQTFDDFTRAVEDGGKSAVQLLKDVDSAEAKLYDDSAKLKGAPLDAVISLIKGFEDLKTRLTEFADASEFQKIQDQVGALDAKFGGLKADTLNMFNGILDQLSAIPGAVAKNGQALLDWLKQAAQLDKALEDQQTKTQAAFDKAYLKYLSDSKQVVPVTASIVEELGHVDTTLQGIAANGGKAWDANPVAQYFAAVQDLNKAGITTLQQQEAQIQNLQKLVDEAAAINAPLGEQLQLQAQLLQGQIKIAEEYGTSANDAVLALEKIRLKQEDLKLSATGYADQFVKAINDIKAGFDQLGGAMSDAIVNGKNMGDALIAVFKKIGQSILTDIINAALVPLKKELNNLIESLLPSANNALTGTQGAIDGLAGSAKKAGDSMDGVGQSAQKMSTQLSSFASALGVISDVISAGAAVASTIILSHISSDTGHIEVNTRECEAELLNVRADLWSQFGQMYQRLGEVKNDADAISDTLKQILAAGGGGGFPQQALTDLDNISHDVHDIDTRVPGLQGALETIARDIVSLGTLLYDPLDVIRQKIGQLLTQSMTANDVLADLPSTADVAAVAQELGGAIDQAGTETSQAAGAAAQLVSGTVIDAGTRNTSVIDTRLAAVVTAAQNQYKAATDISGQIAALRSEYDADIAAMVQAQKDGDLALAEQYRTAAQNVILEIAQANGDAQQSMGAITQAVTSGASTMAFAATGAGTLVAAHVDNAASAISAAVTAAASTPASFKPTGSGTTINVPPAGTQGGTVTSSGTNPGTAVGQQPGFSSTTKQPTNAIPPGPVITSPPMTYDPNLPDPTKPKAPPAPALDTTSPTSNYYIPPASTTPTNGGPLLPGGGGSASTPVSAPTGTTSTASGTAAANGLPTLKGGPIISPIVDNTIVLTSGGNPSATPTTSPAPTMDSQALIDQTQQMIDSLTQQISKAMLTGSTGDVSDLKARLDLMVDRLSKLQSAAAVTGGAEPAPASTGTTTTTSSTNGSNTSTYGNANQPDPQTLGFYAGALAELEDIRVQSHGIRDVVTSFRDGLVAIGKRLMELNSDHGAGKPQASFDVGGTVPFDMLAQVHAGEEILPQDVAGALRSMLRTPNYNGQLRQPNYGDSSGGGLKVFQITAPVTVISRGDPRQQAEQFVTHLKKMVPNAGAFTD